MGKVLRILTEKNEFKGVEEIFRLNHSVIRAFGGLKIHYHWPAWIQESPPYHHQYCTYSAYAWQQQNSHLLEKEQHITAGSGHRTAPLLKLLLQICSAGIVKRIIHNLKITFLSLLIKLIALIVLKLKKFRIKIYLLVVFSQCLSVSMSGTTLITRPLQY